MTTTPAPTEGIRPDPKAILDFSRPKKKAAEPAKNQAKPPAAPAKPQTAPRQGASAAPVKKTAQNAANEAAPKAARVFFAPDGDRRLTINIDKDVKIKLNHYAVDAEVTTGEVIEALAERHIREMEKGNPKLHAELVDMILSRRETNKASKAKA